MQNCNNGGEELKRNQRSKFNDVPAKKNRKQKKNPNFEEEKRDYFQLVKKNCFDIEC